MGRPCIRYLGVSQKKLAQKTISNEIGTNMVANNECESDKEELFTNPSGNKNTANHTKTIIAKPKRLSLFITRIILSYYVPRSISRAIYLPKMSNSIFTTEPTLRVQKFVCSMV